MFENHNKVLFKNVSETSYVYILSGQEFIKNAQNGHFWRVFEKCDNFGDFQTLWAEKWQKIPEREAAARLLL